jgi:hypothetical protein
VVGQTQKKKKAKQTNKQTNILPQSKKKKKRKGNFPFEALKPKKKKPKVTYSLPQFTILQFVQNFKFLLDITILLLLVVHSHLMLS